ncbi:MAG TPA: restriction endonuclease subunit S [Desulfobacterales bacterium]|nr:restriction endonuclease subunit S [Desulfobacterales bacterium]
MNLPAYPKYKPSGVEWLGDVPESWDVLSVKRLTPVQRGASPRPIEDPKYFDEEGEYSWVRIADVTRNHHYLVKTTQRLSELGKKLSVPLEPGVLFLSIAGSVGKPMITKIKACIHDGFVYFPQLEIDPELLYYIFESGQPYLGLGKLGTQLNLNTDTVGNIKVCVPSPSEQQKIADFLDWKTGQIDALIAKKKLLIEKLKEKRIALITHAVTKGLNPNAKMKDSGISWLSEVPEHWEIKPVKFLTRILRGQFSHRPRNDPAYYDGKYPFVQTGDIARANKYVSNYSQTLNNLGLSVSKQFPAGTLVMTIAANIGDMAIINFKACFPDSIVGFVPESNIDLQFLYYMFVAMKQRLLMTAVLNTQLNLNIDRIGSIPTIEPPLGVQKQIVDFLDQNTKKIDTLIAKKQQLIEKLTEYRTALITAATTGKIDVRGIEIPQGRSQ